MKRVICLLGSAFLLNGAAAFAQSELDAYKYSQTDLNGTARYLGMGGAFGALGGDISSMSTNPAGLGIYRSSEIVTTLSLSSIKAKSDWDGLKADRNKTKFNFDNIAYCGYFPTGNDEGLVSWNVGFAYNRVNSFERNYRMSGKQSYSLADYAAAKASYVGTDANGGWFGVKENDMPPFNQINSSANSAYDNLGGVWLPGLAYQSGMIGANTANANDDLYHSAFAEWDNANNTWYPDSRPDLSDLNVNEKGAIDQYAFSFATNISNRVFLGATLSVTDINYQMHSEYTEEYNYTDGSKDHLYWDNDLKTDGTGYSFNIGAIVRPTDFLRVGAAYNSPVWYKLTDTYYGSAETFISSFDPAKANGATPSDPTPYSEYRLRSADKWIFSVAGIIGQTALISFDYELGNYKYMKLSDRDGNDATYENTNKELIQKDFGLAHTFKVGGEVKVTPQFAVRAGVNYRTSPLKKEFREGAFEVFTPGTVAHYTLDKGVTSYSVGLGYRFTPNFYMDLACVYRQYKADAYAFSKVIIQDDKGFHTLVDSKAASLKTNKTQVALTLGYKF